MVKYTETNEIAPFEKKLKSAKILQIKFFSFILMGKHLLNSKENLISFD